MPTLHIQEFSRVARTKAGVVTKGIEYAIYTSPNTRQNILSDMARQADQFRAGKRSGACYSHGEPYTVEAIDSFYAMVAEDGMFWAQKRSDFVDRIKL